MQTAAEIVGSVAAIAIVLWTIFHWKRTRKTWCVIFYHVSRNSSAKFKWPDATRGATDNTLDEKLDQVVGEIESIPCGSLSTFLKTSLLGQQSSAGGVNWEDIHVVYRAVWNIPPIRSDGKPTTRARVVSWRPGAPRLQDDQSFATPPTEPDDRVGFFKWAYQNCPADHYAVFFWGHSIGPGGLFELSTSVAFPQLPEAFEFMPASLIDVEETIRLLYDQRNNLYSAAGPNMTVTGGPAGVAPGGGAGGSTTPPSAGGPGAGTGAPGLGAPPPKIEIVLFQDCWMSTLETAFQLKDIARYVVASQSVVPIGYQYDANQAVAGPLGPVWPYTDLLSVLLSNPTQFAAPVLVTLQGFFDQSEANRLPSLIVPYSLLDLGQGTEITTSLTPKFRSLVQELAPLQKSERLALFRDKSIFKFKNDDMNDDLEAGEWALVDIVKLCHFLSLASSYTSFNPPNATQIQNAAIAILAVVGPQPVGSAAYSLVKQVFESPTVGAAAPLGFTGLSALWIPGKAIETPGGDPYIADQIDNGFYGGLKFVTDTMQTPAGKNWADYAFERRT